MKNNILTWFEIPVLKMERAIAFYETVLDIKLHREQSENLDMAWFPHSDKIYGAGGALVRKNKKHIPSAKGVLIYLSSPTGDLQNELSRVVESGGQVIAEKQIISEAHGYIGIFRDCEGNRLALHSNK